MGVLPVDRLRDHSQVLPCKIKQCYSIGSIRFPKQVGTMRFNGAFTDE